MAKNRNEEVKRELSPYEAAENTRSWNPGAYGYVYRDGVYVDRYEYRYPEIREAFGLY